MVDASLLGIQPQRPYPGQLTSAVSKQREVVSRFSELAPLGGMASMNLFWRREMTLVHGLHISSIVCS